MMFRAIRENKSAADVDWDTGGALGIQYITCQNLSGTVIVESKLGILMWLWSTRQNLWMRGSPRSAP